jgi:hypothetical protein
VTTTHSMRSLHVNNMRDVSRDCLLTTFYSRIDSSGKQATWSGDCCV